MTTPKKNVGGRPRSDSERRVEIACKRMSGRALKVLEDAMAADNPMKLEGRYIIQAAVEVLNRGWGKPRQTIDANVNVTGDALQDKLNAARERVKQEVAAAVATEVKASQIVEQSLPALTISTLQ